MATKLEGGGGKALVAGTLKKSYFLRIFLIYAPMINTMAWLVRPEPYGPIMKLVTIGYKQTSGQSLPCYIRI